MARVMEVFEGRPKGVVRLVLEGALVRLKTVVWAVVEALK